MAEPVIEPKAYPFPDGMVIPRLMPYQEYPWNGDHFIAEEVLRLKEVHGLRDAVETGTCLGSTTCWLAEEFSHVVSIEVNPLYADIAYDRLSELPEVHNRINFQVLKGSSVDLLADQLDADDQFIFLDAHWNEHCPLIDELLAIVFAGVRPCILIHDFQVLGTDFGFDKMPDGRPFNLDLIREHLDAIYGQGNWRHNYPTEVAGARRGWISIEPCL